MSDAWTIGRDHEREASTASRKSRGAFYTPRSVVEGLVRLAIPDAKGLPGIVLDPACGGGAFLVGALDRMVELGLPPREALSRTFGIDIDAGAVRATSRALVAWAQGHGLGPGGLEGGRLVGQVILGDALKGLPGGFPHPQLVVGNPPFATPLRGTVFPESARSFVAKHSDIFGPYTDLAGLHLWAAINLLSPTVGGRVAFVLPQSILASRDTANLRVAIDKVAPVRALWATGEMLFEANVRVCGIVLELANEHGGTSTTFSPPIIASGRDVVEIGLGDDVGRVGHPSWASMAAQALGAPAVRLMGKPLGEMVSATAGFRDEYYALAERCLERSKVGLVGDGEVEAKVVTVGSLDPLRSHWGTRATRFAKRSWHEPVALVQPATENGSDWFQQQLRPKVLLPTQSKVFEPFVDRTGSMLAVTPLLCIFADPQDLDWVAAVLLAPPVVAWSYRQWFGTALSVSAIKLAARDVASIPRPRNKRKWAEAAQLVQDCDDRSAPEIRARVEKIGLLMNEAYEGSTATYEWWRDRLPPL